MKYLKIGFHMGAGGNPTGIGDYMKKLDVAGSPTVIKSADHYGYIAELMGLAKQSGVPHVAIFRMTSMSGRYDFDTPRYDLPPAEAARIHWQATLDHLPPEFRDDPFHKQHVWLEIVNEPDKAQAEWLGAFGVEAGGLALRDGFRVAMFGMRPGEPEPDHWRTEGMLSFLRLAAANKGRLAVALHEYSLDGADLKADFPYHIGRFQDLFAACDENGIARPTVLITEFGWTYNRVPDPAAGMEQIAWAADFYGTRGNIKGAALWDLGPGNNNIADKVQKYIVPMADRGVAMFEPDPEPEPPPEPEPEPEPEPPPPAPAGRSLGADLSHHQGKVDFAKLRSRGVERVYIRATNGDDRLDTRFEEHLEGAREQDLLIGSYHYFQPHQDPLSQAEAFCQRLLDVDGIYRLGLKPAVDLEEKANMRPDIIDRVGRFLEHVEKITGIEPIIYTSAGFWNQFMKGAPYAGKYPIWLAAWTRDKDDTLPWYLDSEEIKAINFGNPKPIQGWDRIAIWQFTSKGDGRHFGVSSERIDLDYVIDEAALLAKPAEWMDIQPFIRTVLLFPPSPDDRHWAWIRKAMTKGVEVDGDTRTIGVACWSALDAIKDVQDAVEIGKENSRLLILDGASIGSGLDEHWIKENAGRLLPYIRWYELPAAPQPGPQPSPQPTGNALLGLHASADGRYSSTEVAEFKTARAGVVKVLSSTDPRLVSELAAALPASPFIVRAFLSFGGRNISPYQFVEDTRRDIQRTLNSIVPARPMWIEIHNEPNLTTEGLGSTWQGGIDFNRWLLDILIRYRAIWPQMQFIYPGLSPGPAIPGLRQRDLGFLAQSFPAAMACDAIGVHAYWSSEPGTQWPISTAVNIISEYTRLFPNKPLWVTEASNNRPAAPAEKAQQYVAFWKALRQKPQVRGVTYFVVSASHPDFAEEVWVGRGIGDIVGKRTA